MKLTAFDNERDRLASILEARGKCGLLVLPTLLLARVISVLRSRFAGANLVITLHKIVLPNVPTETHVHRSALLIELSFGEGS